MNMKCKNCNFKNLDGTKYCQRCGRSLKTKRPPLFSWKDTKVYAGLGHWGSSIAPLGAMKIENTASELGGVTKRSNLVKVQPLEDGSWYCPDCGTKNNPRTMFCKGCGRDFT